MAISVPAMHSDPKHNDLRWRVLASRGHGVDTLCVRVFVTAATTGFRWLHYMQFAHLCTCVYFPT